MKAAYVTRLGPPDNIVYGDLPDPEPVPGQVLVRVRAMAANHVDAHIRSGRYRTPVAFPFVIGRDLVGEVAETGAGVDDFAPGQRVWCNSLGHGGRQGPFSELAVADSERLYPLPDQSDPIEAVALFHLAATAYLAIRRANGVGPGDTVFVGGGAGAVGYCLVQFASTMGARVIASMHGHKDEEWVRAHGATEVVDYRSPEVGNQLRALAPQGVSLYCDTSGRQDLELATSALAERGHIVVLAGIRSHAALPVGPFYFKGATIVGFAISKATVPELSHAAAAINDMLRRNRLEVRIGCASRSRRRSRPTACSRALVTHATSRVASS
jgi:NADPH:quinone reductase-like Zn-dependent oxidoreductase